MGCSPLVLARSMALILAPIPVPTALPPTPISQRDPAVIAKQAGRGGSRDCAAHTVLGCIWQSSTGGTGHKGGCGHSQEPPAPAPSALTPCAAFAPSLQPQRRGACTRAHRDPGQGRGWVGTELLPSAWHSTGHWGGHGSSWSHIRAAPPEQPGACGAALEGNALTPMCCTLGFASLLFLFDFSGPVSFFRLFLL